MPLGCGGLLGGESEACPCFGRRPGRLPASLSAGLQTGGVAAPYPRAVGVRPWGCLGTRRTGPCFPGSGSWRGEQDGPWVHETGRRAFRATQKEDAPTHFKRNSALKFRESPVPPPAHWCRPHPPVLSALALLLSGLPARNARLCPQGLPHSWSSSQPFQAPHSLGPPGLLSRPATRTAWSQVEAGL